MSNEIASLWSAIAATFSAVAALTMMFIHRRNMIDAASPEIVIEGWGREIRKVGETEQDVLTFTKISNVGKGSALHICINATDFLSEKPLTASSTKVISILPSGKEIDVNGQISLFWKNVDKRHEMLPIKITINCWSTKNYRYDTVYNLIAVELNKLALIAGANEVTPRIWLTTRSTKSYAIWKLKVKEFFSRFPAVGSLFDKIRNISLLKIHFSYNSIKELKGLSAEKRKEILLAAGGRLGQSPYFKRVLGLTILMSFIMPTLIGLFFYQLKNNFIFSFMIYIAMLIIGYTIAFSVRVHYLLPHIKDLSEFNEK